MTAMLGQAPIVGEEGCVRFSDAAAHATLPAQGFSLGGGFSFLLDFQSDVMEEQTVFGAREDGGPTLVLTDCPGGEWGDLQFEVRDRAGRAFVADARTSGAHGRRLLCRLDPEKNLLSVVELQPWSAGEPLDVTVRQANAPSDLPGFTNPICLSGCNVNGTRRGQFLGRAAEFALFNHFLPDDRVEPLRSSSVTRVAADLPAFDGSVPALDEEGRLLFVDDAQQLREWIEAGGLERRDTRVASGLAFRWLCDRRPLLRRVSDHYGVLLSLPDLDPLRAYTEAVKNDRPVFIYHRDRWEGNWLAPTAFLGDMAFWLAGEHEVSWEAFIKFVRNNSEAATSIRRTGGVGRFSWIR
jgi:hypothetical protein